MELGEFGMSHGADAEEEQILRLRAVLRDLVRRKGHTGAARELGLDPRTVDACVEGEGMSWRVREALERVTRGDGGGEAARQRERIRALKVRVEALEKGMASRTRDAGDGGGAPGEGNPSAGRQAGGAPGVPGAADTPVPAPEGAWGPERTSLGRRRYTELVTLEPAHDDLEVYGEAWPLVEEWRRIWKAGHRGAGRGLAWLRAEERVRTLEVALLERHGLTLPPEKMPLHGLDRRDQLVWRQRRLHRVRKNLAGAELRRWLREKLTFGLWRD